MKSTNSIFNLKLADYFFAQSLFYDGDIQKKPNTRKLVELPFQQTQAELWEEVTNTLCNLNFIQAKAVAKMTYDLVKDFNLVLGVIPDNAENIRQEKARHARMEKYTRDLIAYAKGEIQELEVPETVPPWSEEQVNAEIEMMKTQTTRLDRLKDFLNFLGQEAGNLQDYAYRFPHFVTQQAWNYTADGPVGKEAEGVLPEVYNSLFRRVPCTRLPWNPIPQIFQSLRSNGSIEAVSLTPDGKRAICGSSNGTCILWDLTTGEAIQSLNGHTSGVIAVSMTPDGKRAISGSLDNTCIYWDLNTGQVINILKGHTAPVTDVEITPDGKKAISSSINMICILWDLNTGKALQSLKGHNSMVTTVSITPDGERAISGSMDCTCIYWDLNTGQIINTLKGHTELVNDVAITYDGKRALSGSYDKTCILWDLTTGEALQILRGHTSYINAVSITPDGKRAISGSNDRTCINWDLNTGQIINTLKGHTGSVKGVAITPEGKKAISCSSNTCILWNLSNGAPLQSPEGHAASVMAVSITPNGKRAISGSGDSTCIIWDLKTGRKIDTLRGHTDLVFDVAITPDAKRAISCSADKTCIIWDLSNSKMINTLKGHTNQVLTVVITPDGKRAISGSLDKTCIIWDLETGQAVGTLKEHKYYVNSIIVSPDCKWINSGELDDPIIWDLDTGKTINTMGRHFKHIHNLNNGPDFKRIINLGSTCLIRDPESKKELCLFVSSSGIGDVSSFPGGVFGGEHSGKVFILNINKELLFPTRSNVTIRHIWDFELHGYQNVSADCPSCWYRFKPPATVIATIEKITKKANLRPEQSPFLELSDEAWEEPGLFGSCPNCHAELKFNPFIAGGDYKPKPAWKFWER